MVRCIPATTQGPAQGRGRTLDPSPETSVEATAPEGSGIGSLAFDSGTATQITRPGDGRVRPRIPDLHHNADGDHRVLVRVQRPAVHRTCVARRSSSGRRGRQRCGGRLPDPPAGRERRLCARPPRSDPAGAHLSGRPERSGLSRPAGRLHPHGHARSGLSTTCTLRSGATLTVPYLASSTSYPASSRCNILAGASAGCQAGHPSVDTIGVRITYLHAWVTPLANLASLDGTGTTLVQSNAMRMEPVL